MLPGGWDLVHAIRFGIKPFAELGVNSEALSEEIPPRIESRRMPIVIADNRGAETGTQLDTSFQDLLW